MKYKICDTVNYNDFQPGQRWHWSCDQSFDKFDFIMEVRCVSASIVELEIIQIMKKTAERDIVGRIYVIQESTFPYIGILELLEGQNKP